jgi:peptidyl-tRNA hydrolase
MSPGKAIAQAGHAYLGSYLNAASQGLIEASAYATQLPGTKISLIGGSESDLRRLQSAVDERGIPSFLVVDQGHVEYPDFDGSPTVTALGIGPVLGRDVRRLLSRLPLWGSTRSTS